MIRVQVVGFRDTSPNCGRRGDDLHIETKEKERKGPLYCL